MAIMAAFFVAVAGTLALLGSTADAVVYALCGVVAAILAHLK
jgi:hypothetical protein